MGQRRTLAATRRRNLGQFAADGFQVADQRPVGPIQGATEALLTEQSTGFQPFPMEFSQLGLHFENGRGRGQQSVLAMDILTPSEWCLGQVVNGQLARAGDEKQLRAGHAPRLVIQLRKQLTVQTTQLGKDGHGVVTYKENPLRSNLLRQHLPVALTDPGGLVI